MKIENETKKKIVSWLSVLLTLGFAGFNLGLYFYYHAKWNLVISFYYLFLLLVKAFCYIFLTKENHKKVYFYISFGMMIVLAISLASPITLMMLGEKENNYGLIVAIAMAAYTTYKIVMTIIQYKKYRKDEKPLVRQLQVIRIYDAIASLMSTQYALVMTNGSLKEAGILALTATSSFVCVALCLYLEILLFLRMKKMD